MKYAALTGLLLAGLAAPALGQEPTRTVWDGVFSAEQAQRGASTYAAQCSQCHGPTPNIQMFDGQPLSELFTFVRTNMPEGAAGSLSGQEYSDAIAYLLEQAGFPAGPEPLPTVSRGMTGILLTFSEDGAAAPAAGAAAPAAPANSLVDDSH